MDEGREPTGGEMLEFLLEEFKSRREWDLSDEEILDGMEDEGLLYSPDQKGALLTWAQNYGGMLDV